MRSGFRAVAGHVSPRDRPATYRHLLRIFREHGSGHVFDHFARQTGRALNVAELVEIYRFHVPNIRLDAETRLVLEHCSRRHRTALITDGAYRMQHNKFQALGLERWIQLPVFTDLLGTAKPDDRPFRMVMHRFPDGGPCVYVADNPRKDFDAPRRLGWTTVRLRRAGGVYEAVPGRCDHEIRSLIEVPALLAP
ncbi:MAG TPA: HAD family hydrolase [Gammaproteobacteria bacterium]